MKIYISKKSELYGKWLFFILIPVQCYGAITTMHDYLYDHKQEAVYAVPMCAIMAILMAYSAFSPSILLIDNDKIILKGLWREIKYDIDDFKEIVLHWSSYKIVFNDGASYWFAPDLGYGLGIFTRTKNIAIITEQINALKHHGRRK